eukprot:scaffold129781_cov33-Tisochrysis_lutea.AAC.5
MKVGLQDEDAQRRPARRSWSYTLRHETTPDRNADGARLVGLVCSARHLVWTQRVGRRLWTAWRDGGPQEARTLVAVELESESKRDVCVRPASRSTPRTC